ncbi:hypothetical protein PVAND_000453 [Polypedilum vanderplanki]|uniref:Choline transporter-like protein n=1 Tax=Polypedilum vanderplanki TaxID=319348 RepID=A0A9J6BK13_POLVA|nr:hypothetical protein PVAND_000453 [Polypedilum vanderplanki]
MDRFRDKMISLRSNGEIRTETNKLWVYFSIAVILLLLCSVTYCGLNGDLKRFLNGYDDCANICGELNVYNYIDGCERQDYRNAPFLQENICVERCDNNYIKLFNRCYRINQEQKDEINVETERTLRDLILTIPGIITVIALSVKFSYIVLLMFRYIIDYVIWFICYAVIAVEIFLTFFTFVQTQNDECKYCTILAVIFAIATSLNVLVLFLLRNKIKLVAQLFKEASKALIDIPLIMIQPVLTFVFYTIAFIIFSYFKAIIDYSGQFEKFGSNVVLVQNNFTIFTYYFNIFVFIWFIQFITGCQHFIIAGTVSKWYFTRDKTKLNQPIRTSYINLISYHLGSICLGSSIITIVKIIRLLFKFLKYLTCSKNVCLCCIGCCIDYIVEKLEDFLKYLIRNSLILIAKNGTPFFESGRRASDMIMRNLMNVISLNYIGDLVLLFGRIFIAVITGFIGFELMNGQPGVNSIFLPMVIAVSFSLSIANCFISVFEMTIDTIFLCYCEDCDENDGSSSKPYYMSNDLKNIMDILNDRVNNTMKFQSLNDLVDS